MKWKKTRYHKERFFLLLFLARFRLFRIRIQIQFEIDRFVVTHYLNIVLGIIEKRWIHKQRSFVDQKRGEHAGNLRNDHIIWSESSLKGK